jgi:hypothetical protein
MRPIPATLATLSVLAGAACSVVGVRSTEEPAFEAIGQVAAVEIRRYPPLLAAEIVIADEERVARNRGFEPLAGYIFGRNRAAERIGMTAPVAQLPVAQLPDASADASAGERIGMTAPVAQLPVSQLPAAQLPDGQLAFRIRFLMPARYDRAALPVPQDAAITLVEVPGRTMAVLRFAGSTAPDAVASRRAALLAALEGSPWQAVGTPEAWFYDPPWTLPALRRTEVAVPVTPRAG